MPDSRVPADMNAYREAVEDAAAYIRSRADAVPDTALILGTGLGGLQDELC